MTEIATTDAVAQSIKPEENPKPVRPAYTLNSQISLTLG